MSQPTTRRPVRPHLHPLLLALAQTARQRRTQERLLTLTYGFILALGRRTLTQIQLTCGWGERDWSACYRLFRTPRIDLDGGERALLAEVAHHHRRHRPFPVVLDATQLRRSSARFVGSGWLKAPRTPPWRPGIHRAQRWVGLSALLPRSAQGDSRCVPLRFLPAPSPSARAWPGQPPRREWQAGLQQLQWLRTELDRLGRASQRILAVADGSYGGAELWRSLPPHTTLLSRCPRNRALFGLPPTPAPGTRGRQRRYGARGPTPVAQLLPRQGWQQTPVAVRGRTVLLRYRVTGPWLVQPAPTQPLFLLVVAGVDRHRRGQRIQREPTYWLVAATPDDQAGWQLPLAAPELLAWAWQRWEVEVLHKELKSGFGLHEPQAWHPVSAELTPRWVAWTVGCLVLAGYRAWGWETGPSGTRWWRPRRWTARDVAAAVRQELWAADRGPMHPAWVTISDDWPTKPPEQWPLTPGLHGSRRI